ERQHEEQARQKQKQPADDIGHRRDKVRAHLALEDRPDVSHLYLPSSSSSSSSASSSISASSPSSSSSSSSSAESSVVNCRKMSSRLRRTGRSSSSPQLLLTAMR